MNRARLVLLVLGAVGLALSAVVTVGCTPAPAEGPKVIVLGVDGLDPVFAQQMMDAGRMPNLAKIAREGTFQPLGTAIVPQSPVAWSDFITGLDSGGHGIYDFLHRDPDTMIPYLSTSLVTPVTKSLSVAGCEIPLAGGENLLMRFGEPFWALAEERGIESSILRMPANYPPVGAGTRELSGMGTPDVHASYGIFSFFTSELFAFSGQDVSGGEVYEIWPEDNVLHAELEGPRHPICPDRGKLTADFSLYLDPDRQAARLVVGDEERVITVGEWTDWVPFEFELLPMQTLPVMARFYLRQMDPELELYVSPFNFDPLNPATPISHPSDFATELADATGRYYSQGMPEDTQALKSLVFDRDDFLAQARIAGDELLEQYEHVLDTYNNGLLFYYFGNIDLISHMLWRSLDPGHPAYDPEVDARYADVIPSLYEEIDGVFGMTMERMGPDTTLIIMSDHGFTSFRRAVNLNTWLASEGYLGTRTTDFTNDPGMYSSVDWSTTTAYGLGIQGLYVNLKGREKNGIVDPADRRALVEEIRDKLLALRDPVTGLPAVTKVYIKEDTFEDGGHLEIGPDIVVGWAHQYRNSDDSTLGKLRPDVFEDNTGEWTGSHLMDHETVPGVFASNRKISREVPSLRHLGAAILAEFGIEGFPRSH